MAYRLKIQEEIIPVEVEIGDTENLKVSVNDKVFEVSYRVISDNQIHLTLNGSERGKRLNAYLADGPDGKLLMIKGTTYLVQDADACKPGTPRKGSADDIPQEVTPPMPAVVVKINVAEGDRVAKGQSVIVVSAMKMETTLFAPYDGVVKKLNVAVNDKVAPGQILLDIEKAD